LIAGSLPIAVTLADRREQMTRCIALDATTECAPGTCALMVEGLDGAAMRNEEML
jgi:hypothetical protein